jgi:RNA 3'-terminal phosphate cyclase (ATP)
VANDIITINGSSGGGQMLRNAVALSAVTGRPVRVTDIRGARPQPGLRPQHLLAVRATAEACGGRLLGAEIGSREIEFRPGAVRSPPLPPFGKGGAVARETCPTPAETAAGVGYKLDVGTAGSVLLILQSLLPALALADGPSNITLIGGTDVPFAPPFDHFDRVFLPALSEMGPRITMQLVRRGFYPKGGGELRVSVEPAPAVRAFSWCERGSVTRIAGRSYSQGLPSHIAERMRDSAVNVLRDSGYRPEVELEVVEGGRESGRRLREACAGGVHEPRPQASDGCGIVLWVDCEGGRRLAGSALGRRGKRAEEVGREAAHALLGELAVREPAEGLPYGGPAVETHLADQLIVWMAMANGPSEFTTGKITDHVCNAVTVAEAIAGARYTLEEGRPARVKCEPAVLARRSLGVGG